MLFQSISTYLFLCSSLSLQSVFSLGRWQRFPIVVACIFNWPLDENSEVISQDYKKMLNYMCTLCEKLPRLFLLLFDYLFWSGQWNKTRFSCTPFSRELEYFCMYPSHLNGGTISSNLTEGGWEPEAKWLDQWVSMDWKKSFQ